MVSEAEEQSMHEIMMVWEEAKTSPLVAFDTSSGNEVCASVPEFRGTIALPWRN